MSKKDLCMYVCKCAALTAKERNSVLTYIKFNSTRRRPEFVEI